jgi:hypothetical protein
MHIRSAMLSIATLTVPALAETLTLAPDARPDWLRRDGVVMAGSWEPLPARVQRDGSPGHTPTPEQRAAYEREHTPEMLARLKALGANFIMIHGYKSLGRSVEAESMQDAVRFARLCHEAGLHVGVYTNSGTITWEPFYKERPEARDWLILDAAGKPKIYGSYSYRYCWDRNHPAVRDYMHDLTRWAVNDVHADLLHYDNYIFGPGYEPLSTPRFREYLCRTFTPEQRKKLGIPDIDTVTPPLPDAPDGIVRRAWLDFCCQSLADSYLDLSRFARSLRKDVLVECNPTGPGERITPPVDHARLIPGGEAFWDEMTPRPGIRNGRLYTRICTYKVARRMNNLAFAYVINPLEAAESMAFNQDCLGCIVWFEYGRFSALPEANVPLSESMRPYVDFFHRRRDLLRDAAVVADVAVLRSFPSQVFADPRNAALTARVEHELIKARVPFQIIYDTQLDDLARYRCLVLAGCVALSDKQLGQIRQFVTSGGKLCILGPVATHNEWLTPRDRPALDNLPAASIVPAAETADPVQSVRRACDHRLSMDVQAPPGFCAELTDQPIRRLLHLVNYTGAAAPTDVTASIEILAHHRVRSVTLANPLRSGELPVIFNEAAGRVSFKLKPTDVYEIAVITWDAVQ